MDRKSKKIFIILIMNLFIVIIITLIVCLYAIYESNSNNKTYTIKAEIVNTDEKFGMYVKVLECNAGYKLDYCRLGINGQEYENGQVILVYYDGLYEATNPPMVNNIKKIEVIEQ